MLLGYADSDLVNRSGYAMVHHDDLAYVASAHQEREYRQTCTARVQPEVYNSRHGGQLIGGENGNSTRGWWG